MAKIPLNYLSKSTVQLAGVDKLNARTARNPWAGAAGVAKGAQLRTPTLNPVQLNPSPMKTPIDKVGAVIQGDRVAHTANALADAAFRVADQKNTLLAQEAVARLQDRFREIEYNGSDPYYAKTGKAAVMAMPEHQAKADQILQEEYENLDPHVQQKVFVPFQSQVNQVKESSSKYATQHMKSWEEDVDNLTIASAEENLAGNLINPEQASFIKMQAVTEAFADPMNHATGQVDAGLQLKRVSAFDELSLAELRHIYTSPTGVDGVKDRITYFKQEGIVSQNALLKAEAYYQSISDDAITRQVRDINLINKLDAQTEKRFMQQLQLDISESKQSGDYSSLANIEDRIQYGINEGFLSPETADWMRQRASSADTVVTDQDQLMNLNMKLTALNQVGEPITPEMRTSLITEITESELDTGTAVNLINQVTSVGDPVKNRQKAFWADAIEQRIFPERLMFLDGRAIDTPHRAEFNNRIEELNARIDAGQDPAEFVPKWLDANNPNNIYGGNPTEFIAPFLDSRFPHSQPKTIEQWNENRQKLSSLRANEGLSRGEYRSHLVRFADYLKVLRIEEDLPQLKSQ